jgi:hypothetical protein
MDSTTYFVDVFRDVTKEELIITIPIKDLGMVRDAAKGPEPTGAEGLIHIAKLQLKATTSEDVDSLTYDVRKA